MNDVKLIFFLRLNQHSSNYNPYCNQLTRPAIGIPEQHQRKTSIIILSIFMFITGVTGRSGVLCRRYLHSLSRSFNMNRVGWKFHVLIKRNRYYSAVSIEICSVKHSIFEQELQSAMKTTEYIIIGGDWNAHLHGWIITSMMWVQYQNHVVITTNRTTKIETWNLRSNKWEQFRLRLKRNIGIKTICINNKPWWSDKSITKASSKIKEQILYAVLVNKETSSVARSDIDKAYLLAEPPQPPKDVDEKHYELVEDDIRFKMVISKPLELNDYFIGVSDIHQNDITKRRSSFFVNLIPSFLLLCESHHIAMNRLGVAFGITHLCLLGSFYIDILPLRDFPIRNTCIRCAFLNNMVAFPASL
ncbi:hypothetical protein RFI_20794, partial [Reticulomyxa filosa]